MFFVTGDTHGCFNRIESFCNKYNTSKNDILIILGDAGINYNSARADLIKKTIFTIIAYYNICDS